jgi:hypothetical protein
LTGAGAGFQSGAPFSNVPEGDQAMLKLFMLSSLPS